MGMLQGVISLTISVILIVNLFIVTVKAQNTTGWSASEVTIFGLLSLLSIVGLLYGVGNVFGIL